MAESIALPGYEVTYITRPEMSAVVYSALREKVMGIIAAHKGEVVLEEDWGKRKLAYNISKESRGRYTFFAYTGDTGVVAEIERNLRINENVIRFLTVNLAKEFDKEEFNKNHVSPLKAPKFEEKYGRGDDYDGEDY